MGPPLAAPYWFTAPAGSWPHRGGFTLADTDLGPQEKPVLLLDLDGICTDLASKWLATYNRDWQDHLTLAGITEWNWDRFVKPECGKKIFHYLNRPGFFADLQPIPGAVESLRSLAEFWEPVIVTASPRQAMSDKVQWVRRHLPFVLRHNIVITYRKDLVRGHAMLDDAPRNLRHFQGVRVLMDYPHNRDFHDCYRVHNWAECHTFLHGLALALRAGERPGWSPPARPDIPTVTGGLADGAATAGYS